MMLNQVADRIPALVMTPPESTDSFDERGCLLPHPSIVSFFLMRSKEMQEG